MNPMRALFICIPLVVFSCTQAPGEMDGGSPLGGGGATGGGDTGGGTGGGGVVNPLPYLTLEGATAACTAPEQLGRSGGRCLPNGGCNPFRVDACVTADELCDWRGDAFSCAAAWPVDVGDCQPCDAANAHFCAQGLTCIDGQCVRYCCDDSDCGADARCQKSELDQTTAGACVAKPAEPCTAADALYDAGTCATCMNTNCCAEVKACAGDDACRACVGGDEFACWATSNDSIVITCRVARCDAACPPPPRPMGPSCTAVSAPPVGACAALDVDAGISCNLVTNEGCPSGTTCEAGGTQCAPTPLGAAVCSTCSLDFGPFCAGGLDCFGGKCTRWCCSSAECGAGATCVVPDGGAVGHCLE